MFFVVIVFVETHVLHLFRMESIMARDFSILHDSTQRKFMPNLILHMT